MKTLHVIALNIPYPPNYGGVIDIYYKLLALHRLGVRLILHCYEYERPRAPELERICAEVHYYPRRTKPISETFRRLPAARSRFPRHFSPFLPREMTFRRIFPVSRRKK